MARGHVKKREWLGGTALSSDPVRRAEQVQQITAQAKAEGRALAPLRATYQARVPSPTNRRKDVVKSFKLKRDAERWLTTQADSIGDGSFIDPRRGHTTFAAVAEEWKETWVKLAPKTRVGYESILNHHVLPAFGPAHISSLQPKDVQDFANELATRVQPNTVRRVMDVLRGVLSLAVSRRYIATSPAVGVDLAPKGDGPTISPLTHAEVRALMDALPQHWRLPVLLDVYTGLRAGELWALRVQDVNAIRGELLIDEAIKEVTSAMSVNVPAHQRLTPSLIVGPTKTYAKRRVSVPAFLREELKAHLASPLPGGNGPEAFLFTTTEGLPVRHNLFYKRVFTEAARTAFPERTAVAEAAALAAGKRRRKLCPVRFHDLRHTCAAWLIEAGAHPLQIKLRLGHRDIQTTMNTYGHLFPSAEPAMADLLDAGYRSADSPGLALVA